MTTSTITRRSLLGVAAVAGLSAVISGCAPQSGLQEASEDDLAATGEDGEVTIVKTLCAACVGRCGMLAHVRNGRVIKVEGDPDQVFNKGKMCAKGLSQLQMLYNPNRVKYPMRRVGERGENKWERVSWDEALSDIADALIESYEKCGPEALIGGHGGGGHPYYSGDMTRFFNVYGSRNLFEGGGVQCLVPRTMPYKMITGHGATDPCSREGLWPEMLDLVGNMKCCVLWGSNPAQSDIGSCERGLDELRQAGVKTVVVDPRFTPDASKADIWLPVRPGTDVAVTMSWIKYIMDNEKYDRDFVMRWSTMPYLVNTETMRFVKPEDAGEEAEEYAYMVWDAKTGSAKKMSYPYDESLEPALEGGPYIVNGIECKPGFQMLKERVAEWTFEKAGEISWVEPALIEEACKLYAENTPGSLCTGMAGDHNINSVQFGMSAAILEGLMGNGYKPGTIMQKFVGGVTDYWSGANTLNYFMTKDEYEKEFGLADYRGILAAGFIHNAYLLKGLLEGDPYQPHVMIDESLNKMTNMPQADLWEEGFRKLDFIVHHTMYPTSFSMLADYLLPQAEILEMNFVWGLYNVGYVRQAATHLWEVIEEPLFFSLLAKKMAEKGMPRFQRACDAAAVLPDAEPLPEGYIGDTGDWGAIPYWSTTQEMHDELWKQQGLEHNWESYVRECEEKGYYEAMGEQEFKDYQYYHYEQIDEETGLPNGFSTTTKKMQLYCDDWIEMGLNGYPYSDYVLDPSPLEYDPMPFYQEPEESPLDAELAAEFPLVFTGGHNREMTHATLRNVPWIRERFPTPQLSIHPDDAEKYGVAHGEWVWIESKRNRIRGVAKVTAAIRPGVVHMERWWWPETMTTDTLGYKESNANMITPVFCQYSSIMGSTVYRGFQVKVYPADEGAPEGIWTEPEQFEAWLPNYDEVEVTDKDFQVGGAQ